MKVVFIYPDLITPMISFCPAVSSLSSVLKRAGYQTTLIHINNKYGVVYNQEVITDRIRQEKPDLIGVTATSFNYRQANDIAGFLKKEFPNIPLILGGPHATIQPGDQNSSNFDAFCIGEGEEPLLQIVRALESGEDWKRIVLRGRVKDLNSLPDLDFDIIDTPKILRLRNGWLSISFSRGCPHSCTFCANQTPEVVRYRSPENTVRELGLLAKKFEIKVFNFDDDNLPSSRVWMRDFMDRYKHEVFDIYNIKYSMNFHATSLDEELAKELAWSGCMEARIGFETGNEFLRKSVLNKRVSNRSLIEAFAACDKYGIHTTAFAMMGIPGETSETVQETIRMISKLQPYLIRMTFLSPYAHTKIFDWCVERNLFKSQDHLTDEFSESPLRFEKLTDEQIFKFRFLFPWYVNALWFGEPYQTAITQFTRKSVPEIIEQDTQLSSLCSQPHYKYFDDNLYYFQLKGKYDNNTNSL